MYVRCVVFKFPFSMWYHTAAVCLAVLYQWSKHQGSGYSNVYSFICKSRYWTPLPLYTILPYKNRNNSFIFLRTWTESQFTKWDKMLEKQSSWGQRLFFGLTPWCPGIQCSTLSARGSSVGIIHWPKSYLHRHPRPQNFSSSERVGSQTSLNPRGSNDILDKKN